MKLKRMWPSVCIWVLFIIFDVIMVASSGFFSGLFPSSNIIPYTCATTIVGVLVMGLFTFLFGRFADVVYADEMAKTAMGKALYAVTMTATIIAGAFYRFDVLARITAEPSGKLSLYQNAMVGAGASTEYDLLSILYSKLLNIVLHFTGNRIVFAYYFQIVLFMLFVAVGAEAVRMLLGKVPSLCFALYTSFMPVFLDGISSATIGTDELFYLMYGLEILILAIYLKLDSDHKYESKAWIIWFVIVGLAVGFMTYVDAGTLIVVLPLLLSGLFILDNDVVLELLRLVMIAISGLAIFFAMIFQEGGTNNFDTILSQWGRYFFKNVNTFNTFWTYTNYKIEYLVTFVVMSGVLVGFWKNRIFERITPWLFGTMLVFFATPFFGATKMNSEIMLTIYFGFVLACVASLIMTNKLEGKLEVSDEAEEAEPEVEAVAEESSMQVVTPQVTEPEKEDEVSETEAEPATAAEPEEPIEHETETTEEPIEPEKVVDSEHIENENAAFDGYAKRYVPEGMVLPEGSEDEMDTSQSRMKMPEFKGTIALDRKKPVKEEPVAAAEPENKEPEKTERPEPSKKAAPTRKDDFDIAFKPGDDFDI